MAKQRRVLPARRQDATDDSLLMRSAESLGRMIGTLQRQLDAARHLTGVTNDGEDRRNGNAVKRTSRGGQTSKAKKSGTTKGRSTSSHKSTRVAKSVAAKKASPRRRSSGGSRTSKSGRGA